MRQIYLNQKGQGLIEYLIIVALMAVATIGVVSILGQTVKAKFTQVTYGIRGGDSPKSVKFDHINASDYSAKDMSDFFQGTNKSHRSDSLSGDSAADGN
jgi:pilus assembly protein Flp/PilA